MFRFRVRLREIEREREREIYIYIVDQDFSNTFPGRLVSFYTDEEAVVADLLFGGPGKRPKDEDGKT